jgi:Anti-sigma regulatory factor (Ser/Thr protein kinase)
MKTCFHFSTKADIENLPQIAGWLEETLAGAGVGEKDQFEIGLAVDEACSNIILYGYADRSGTIDIESCIRDDELTVTIEDAGKPFNPLEVTPPVLDADIDHRKIGGLGVHLIRSVTDDLFYEYRDGKNILTLVKVRGAVGCG